MYQASLDISEIPLVLSMMQIDTEACQQFRIYIQVNGAYVCKNSNYKIKVKCACDQLKVYNTSGSTIFLDWFNASWTSQKNDTKNSSITTTIDSLYFKESKENGMFYAKRQVASHFIRKI